MNSKSVASLILSVLLAAAHASAASWGTQQVLGSNAFSGSVALDASGNMVGVWYQSSLSNGTAVNEIWASTAPFGQPWSAPLNISGPIGVASGNPVVHSSAAGKATAIYTSPSFGGTFVDHPAGGSWGTPSTTNGVNQFFASNDHGDQALAWGTGGARPSSSTVVVVLRPSGGAWSQPTTLAAAAHLSFDGAVVAPDGSAAVAWESFDSVCGSRTCKTSNWVLHVSTHAVGAQSWVDSGGLPGPSATQHFGQLAADNSGNLAVVSLSGTNVVSTVRHGSTWSGTAVVAPLGSLQFYTGTGRDNRIFATDSLGHATIVSWGNPQLTNLVAVDGNLNSNTWGSPTVISGPDQYPNYFYFTMSSSGAAIAFWSISPVNGGGNTFWRAAVRPSAGAAWNAPATAGTSQLL